MTDRLRSPWWQAGVLAVLGAIRMAWQPDERLCMSMIAGACIGLAAAIVAGAGIAAAGARAWWLLQRVRQAITATTFVPTPPPVSEAMRRTGVTRVRCVDAATRLAFCAGAIRPTVYLGPALVDALGTDALDAVLVHESEHARRRDPLRRAIQRAIADVFFCVPVAAWWHRRSIEDSELAADRAAIGAVGAAAVAEALWSAAPEHSAANTELLPAFDGSEQARVAQLLGDDLPSRRPSAMALLVSFGVLSLLVSLAMCVGQELVRSVIN
ncbi:M56 family metallopeptidase [Catenulispora rubra]|uniref:M56 family metallopeptidase n=1 Tax=Catenulispora rubra TaxID=280293 RepID=UPI0018927805|nr:M56 family metallopeptidase [Catenulispora rubra]